MAETELLVREEEGEALSSDSVVVGVIVGFDAGGGPNVSFPGCAFEKGITARSTVVLKNLDIGRQVALLFECGDAKRPLIIGRIQSLVPADQSLSGTKSVKTEEVPQQQTVDVSLDGERLTLSAEREIVLRCGKASITLTRAGKIILRGAYLLNRSSGVNKIKGASVQIN